MAARKTIRVSDVVVIVNEMLNNSTCDPEARRGMIQVLVQVLHQTDNYDGHRYLTAFDNVPEGHSVGIEWDGEGDNRKSFFPDDTRRQYGCKSERLEQLRKDRAHCRAADETLKQLCGETDECDCSDA